MADLQSVKHFYNVYGLVCIRVLALTSRNTQVSLTSKKVVPDCNGAVPRTDLEAMASFSLTSLTVFFALRVEFLLKTDSGYPRDAGVLFHPRWQTLGVPFALTPIGQLRQSPPSSVPGDWARGKPQSRRAPQESDQSLHVFFPPVFHSLRGELRVFWTIFPVF